MKVVLFTLTALVLAGCSSEEVAEKTTTSSEATSLPNSFFTTDRPINVKDLTEVKKSAKTGDDVTFLARIGGRKNASFVSSLSMMIVADPTLRSCELMGEEDHCATPEDYCCENRDKVNKGLATVRFLNTDGEVFPFSIAGDHKLETLKYVVVNGNVVDMNDEGVFIIDANKVWVGGKPSYNHERAGSGE